MLEKIVLSYLWVIFIFLPVNLLVICENKQSIGFIYSSHIQEKNITCQWTQLQFCKCVCVGVYDHVEYVIL